MFLYIRTLFSLSAYTSTLKMEAADSTETLVLIYLSTQCDILENSNVSIYSSDSLNSRIQMQAWSRGLFGGTKPGLKETSYVLHVDVNTRWEFSGRSGHLLYKRSYY
jgi:hypothetical protein